MNLQIENCTFWQGGTEVVEGSIGINDSKIAWLGEIPQGWQADKIINGKNKLALPGLINTHNHAAMSLFRSYADDLKLQEWLENKIWPIEAKLESKDIYWGTQLAILEMIQSGTTTFCDMYFFMDEVAKAVDESGMRAVLCRGITAFGNDGDEKLLESEQLYRDWHGKGDGRIEVWHGPHAPYTCPPDFLKKVVASSEKMGMNIHIHLAETKKEVEDCLTQYGKTPIELMESVGLLNHHVLGAHCVHLTENDMDIMALRNVKVAHNIGSNLKLVSGIAPVPQLLEKGITVSIGTDGAASNNNLDLLEELRLTALVHKNHSGDPTILPAHQVLQLGTIQGADALGQADKIGSLEVGKKADMILINMSAPQWQPKHNVISNYIYSSSANDVTDVIINGKVVYENKEFKTLDSEKIIFEANQSAGRLTRQ